MTRIRHYEKDTPFGDWLRNQGHNGNLPSSSIDLGVTATDIDMLVKNYKNHHTGKELKAMFWVEVKTRSAVPRFAQESIFSMMHLFTGQREFTDDVIRFYGVFRLILSGTSPTNSKCIEWHRFNWSKDNPKRMVTESDLRKTVITEQQLIQILRMDIHPVSLKKWTPESHHGETVDVENYRTPLFPDGVPRPIRKMY